jgi:protein Tex
VHEATIMLSQQLLQKLSRELSIDALRINGALTLFAEGATLPFVARYRKEATGGLDEVQLAAIRDRAEYLEDLEARRATILASIEEQGKLDAALRARIEAAETKQVLEDLYLPYRPKRRTRATIARERGLEPLADALWSGELNDAAAETRARVFVDVAKEVPDVAACSLGASMRPWMRSPSSSIVWLSSRALRKCSCSSLRRTRIGVWSRLRSRRSFAWS